MSRSSFSTFRTFSVVAMLATLIGGATSASAQGPEAIKFVTADGVKLHGTFYPGAKKDAPTVIILHPIGEGKSSKSQELKSLAEALEKANYAVLTFDFRGHGDSTAIDDQLAFRSKKINALAKNKDPEVIDVKDYIKNGKAYLPVLCNDIAAARAWLERRNDAGKDCNTSSLVIIGADQSATLGALWINSEWHRYKYSPPPNFPGVIPKFFETKPEGKDIIAAVFLTPQPSFSSSTVDKRIVSVSGLLKVACKENAMAAAFLFGKDEPTSRDFAKNIVKALKVKDKDGKESNKHRFIGPIELDTKLTGIKLLQKGLGTEKAIIESFLDPVMDDRKNERVDRDFQNSIYYWRAPNGGWIPAKSKKGDKNLNFDDYYKYIPQ